MDVIISVYMLGALGDFEVGVYKLGYDRYAAMAMFIIATFIICVVFMNMLIAIMGETFGQVTEESEISGLKEQIVMINDHAWLVDLHKIFKNQKYIIRVAPSNPSGSVQKDAMYNIVKETEETIIKRINRNQGLIQKRMDHVDNNTRYLLKYQDLAINGVSKKVRNLEKLIKTTFIRDDDDLNQDMTE